MERTVEEIEPNHVRYLKRSPRSRSVHLVPQSHLPKRQGREWWNLSRGTKYGPEGLFTQRSPESLYFRSVRSTCEYNSSRSRLSNLPEMVSLI